jgi:hypothetical protein
VTVRVLLAGTLVLALGPRAAWAGPDQTGPATAAPVAAVRQVQRLHPAFSPVRLSLAARVQPVEPMHTVPTDPAPVAGEPIALTQKWWFWAAVGTLVVSSVVLLVVATRESGPPRTQLGNMEAFR